MERHQRVFAHRAYDILHDTVHIDETARALGIPDAVEFPGARWPGFLGSKFVMGQGVLAIANVHREFHSGRMAREGHTTIARTVAATRRLQSASPSQVTELDLAEYLDGHRAAYLHGLSGGWSVGQAFRPGFEACGVEFSGDGLDSVCYLNWSCCQVPEDGRFRRARVSPAAVKRQLRELCGRRHPIAGLVKALSPEVVLCTSAAAHRELSADRFLDTTTVVYFHQVRRDHYLLADVELDGTHFRAVDQPKVSTWAPALARHLARR